MTAKKIQHMSKRELRDACWHQRSVIQSLLTAHASLKPLPPLVESAEESAQRALDAYE